MAETRAIEVVGDYPHNVIDFDRRFDSEEACTAYLVSLRWPQGFVCPACGGRRAWRRTRLAMLCASCRHETSIIAGTLFEKTHKPLQVWFKAMWWVTSQKTGASALGLQRILGLGSYETAWLWLHKLRPAMVRSGRDRLTGCVEVDETYVGGPEEGVQGRETHEKSIVAIAVEVHSPKGFGRVRMRLFGGEPHAVRARSGGARGSRKDRRVEGIIQLQAYQIWLHPPPQKHLCQRQPGPRSDAGSSPGRCAAEALAPWDSPRLRKRQALGLLPRRVCLSLQPSDLDAPWPTLLPPDAASCGY